MKKQKNMNKGAAILFLIFGLLFFVLMFRFVTIQTTGEAGGKALVAKAEQKYLKERVIDAKRGTIFDRNGEIIAEDTNSYKLVAILDKKMTSNPDKPLHVVDPDKTAEQLAPLLEMEKHDIYKQLTKKGLFQVEFGRAGRNISHSIKKQIEELKLPGITFIRESKRFYPNGIFASHTIGFVEKKDQKNGETDVSGSLGIEKYLDPFLKEKNGLIKYESDLWGYLLPDGEEHIDPPVNGKNVYLTIDKKIQTFLEDALNRVDEEYKPKRIIAIVADPKTGEILAMGQRPTFHPITRVGISDSWHNEAIESSFEPGSTMKIFTLAAAIEEKAFPPNELFQSGSYAVGPNYVRDHNGVGWGQITFLEGVQRSSNVAFSILVEKKLGFDKFREYLKTFGFEQPTGISLPNETGGKIVYQYPLEKVTTAFGQGSAITPIQQIQAVSAIANDGKMVKPTIVQKIVDSKNGKTISESTPKVVGTPISAKTAKEVRDILETVVTSPKGTGGKYKIEGYDVAGKTGTAQIPGPNGQYLSGQDNYIFSFMGMVPKNDPKLVMYVAVQQPDLEGYEVGADPVSMIFNPVMKNSLQYLNIEPTNMESTKTIKVPNVEEKPRSEASEIIKSLGLVPIVIGDGDKIVEQIPSSNSTILENEKVFLKTNGSIIVQDMTGWSLRDVLKFVKIADLKLNKVGYGYVVKQNVSAGTKIKEGSDLIVQFETPYQQFQKKKKKEEGKTEEIELKE